VANNIPFQPMGNTVVLSVTGSSSNTSVTAASPVNQLSIVNGGTNVVFLTVSATANPVAILPNTSTSQVGFAVAPQTQRTITALQSSATTTVYVAGIAPGGTNTVYITPGEGI
jgi:hypothetical protein